MEPCCFLVLQELNLFGLLLGGVLVFLVFGAWFCWMGGKMHLGSKHLTVDAAYSLPLLYKLLLLLLATKNLFITDVHI